MSDHEIVLRAAAQSDAADLAILDNLAGNGISLWFWQGAVKQGIAEGAFEWGRACFLYADTICVAQYHHSRQKHGQGIGKVLLIDAVRRAEASKVGQMHLVAEDSYSSALALYQRFGFSTVDERPYIQFGFASESTKWLLMTKSL